MDIATTPAQCGIGDWTPPTDNIFDTLHERYLDFLADRVNTKAALDITDRDLRSLRCSDRLRQESRIAEARSVAHKLARRRLRWPDQETATEREKVWRDIVVGRIPTIPPPFVQRNEPTRFKPRGLYQPRGRR